MTESQPITCTPNTFINIITTRNQSEAKIALDSINALHPNGFPSDIAAIANETVSHTSDQTNHHYIVLIAFCESDAYFKRVQDRTSYDLRPLRTRLRTFVRDFCTGRLRINEPLMRLVAFVDLVRDMVSID